MRTYIDFTGTAHSYMNNICEKLESLADSVLMAQVLAKCGCSDVWVERFKEAKRAIATANKELAEEVGNA